MINLTTSVTAPPRTTADFLKRQLALKLDPVEKL